MPAALRRNVEAVIKRLNELGVVVEELPGGWGGSSVVTELASSESGTILSEQKSRMQ